MYGSRAFLRAIYWKVEVYRTGERDDDAAERKMVMRTERWTSEQKAERNTDHGRNIRQTERQTERERQTDRQTDRKEDEEMQGLK